MRIMTQGKLYNVDLGDDGTMDTVIEVSDYYGHSQDVRFGDTSHLRKENGDMTLRGFRELAYEAIEALEESLA